MATEGLSKAAKMMQQSIFQERQS